MKRMPNDMHREVMAAMNEAAQARDKVMDLINNPVGAREEALEDALNWFQDAAYRARRAYRVEAARAERPAERLSVIPATPKKGRRPRV